MRTVIVPAIIVAVGGGNAADHATTAPRLADRANWWPRAMPPHASADDELRALAAGFWAPPGTVGVGTSSSQRNVLKTMRALDAARTDA